MSSPDPARAPARRVRTRTWLLLLVGAALLALLWPSRWVAPRAAKTARSPQPLAEPGPTPATHLAGGTRSTAGLSIPAGENILPDHRTAKEQKDEIVKQWGEFLNAEKARLGAATFDPLAKRWLERPRLQALIEEWKALEQAWPERSEPERDAQLPRIRAMWTEAMTEFAAELAAAGQATTLPAPR
jgi:hypothetical protein